MELARVCAIDEINTVLTDDTADRAVVAAPQASGVSIEIAR